MRGAGWGAAGRGAGVGPHKQDSQRDAVWRWQVGPPWCLLRCQWLNHLRPPPTPHLRSHNEETVSTRGEIRITMGRVNDACAIKASLKKTLGLRVTENERSVFLLITWSQF